MRLPCSWRPYLFQNQGICGIVGRKAPVEGYVHKTSGFREGHKVGVTPAPTRHSCQASARTSSSSRALAIVSAVIRKDPGWRDGTKGSFTRRRWDALPASPSNSWTTASKINARRVRPCVAVSTLTRRKMASGNTTVVFIKP